MNFGGPESISFDIFSACYILPWISLTSLDFHESPVHWSEHLFMVAKSRCLWSSDVHLAFDFHNYKLVWNSGRCIKQEDFCWTVLSNVAFNMLSLCEDCDVYTEWPTTKGEDDGFQNISVDTWKPLPRSPREAGYQSGAFKYSLLYNMSAGNLSLSTSWLVPSVDITPLWKK